MDNIYIVHVIRIVHYYKNTPLHPKYIYIDIVWEIHITPLDGTCVTHTHLDLRTTHSLTSRNATHTQRTRTRNAHATHTQRTRTRNAHATHTHTQRTRNAHAHILISQDIRSPHVRSPHVRSPHVRSPVHHVWLRLLRNLQYAFRERRFCIFCTFCI
jgi:hypothetical protein